MVCFTFIKLLRFSEIVEGQWEIQLLYPILVVSELQTWRALGGVGAEHSAANQDSVYEAASRSVDRRWSWRGDKVGPSVIIHLESRWRGYCDAGGGIVTLGGRGYSLRSICDGAAVIQCIMV